jgi:hypothetical protein
MTGFRSHFLLEHLPSCNRFRRRGDRPLSHLGKQRQSEGTCGSACRSGPRRRRNWPSGTLPVTGE